MGADDDAARPLPNGAAWDWSKDYERWDTWEAVVEDETAPGDAAARDLARQRSAERHR